MRAVNLLPSESKAGSRRAPQPAILAAAISGVVAVAVIGGGNLIQTARVSSAQKTLNAAKIQLAATPLPPKVAQVTPPPPVVAQEMQPRLAAVSTALSTRIAWDRILREFSLVLPSHVQLSTLGLTQPGAGPTSTSGLQLTGITYSYADVARLEFTGKDTAAGKSFETWVKKYHARKAAGETDIRIDPEKLD